MAIIYQMYDRRNKVIRRFFMDTALVIRKMIVEATSPYNDGYTTRYYWDRLIELKCILDEFIPQHEIERLADELGD